MPSSRSIDAPRRHPDRLHHLTAGADQDPLLRLGLDQDHGLDPDQIAVRAVRVLHRLDRNLDRVRNLLARAREHLLAHELGEHHSLRLVGALLGLEVERPRGQERNQVIDERTDPRAR